MTNFVQIVKFRIEKKKLDGKKVQIGFHSNYTD